MPADDESWPLEHTPQAASAARQITRQVLGAWETSEEAEQAALLVVSELVTNAVEHAQAPVVLHLHRQHAYGQLWVGVTDGGPAEAEEEGAWTTSCTPDEHGRGLTLVEALSEIHGTHTTRVGSTRWARLHAA
ncbi:ATP-binding protein [Streptomyces virginiae]|uniref:ATP-binding protein n=1 Tax=Streptomyces virginiae TaxID=1961 RepID=UPI0036BE48B1